MSMADYYYDYADLADHDNKLAAASRLAEDQRIWDMVHGVRPGSNRTCKHCGGTNLYWVNTAEGYRLHDGRSGELHVCNS